MEKTVQIFTNFSDAEAADIEEDLRMTPEQRISIVLNLQKRIYPDAAQRSESEARFARVCRITQLPRG